MSSLRVFGRKHQLERFFVQQGEPQAGGSRSWLTVVVIADHDVETPKHELGQCLLQLYLRDLDANRRVAPPQTRQGWYEDMAGGGLQPGGPDGSPHISAQ